MKAYCENCQKIQPATFRPGEDAVTNEPYEDLCCDECHSIIAAIQNRGQNPQVTEELQKGFEAVVKPVIEWISHNMHPHTHIVIDSTHAELSEGTLCVQTTEYLRD